MRVSPSQIVLSRTCLRKWAFAYIEGFREPEGPSQELGTRVHATLEGYLRDGTRIDLLTEEGKIAQPGIPWLPSPGTGETEQEITLHRQGFSFFGIIDWTGKDFLGQGPNVIDHKTTSDFRWAKTPEILAEDPQALVYSGAVLGNDPQVHGRWLYYRTKRSPAALPVDFVLTRSQIQEGLGELTVEAATLVALRTENVDPLSLPPSPEACFSYQRLCPHAHRCNLTALQRIQRMQPIGKESLLAQLKAKQMATLPATAPSTAPAADPVLPSALPPIPGSTVIVATAAPVAAPDPRIAELQAQLAALQNPAPVAPVAAPVILPPAAPSVPVLTALPTVPEAPPVQAPEPPAMVIPPVVKRGPGRPRKNPEAPAAAPAASVAVSVSNGPSPQTDTPIETLYVNCIPIGGHNVLPVNDLMQEAHAEIQKELGVHYKHVEFGKGPALFASCVGEAAKRNPGSYYLDSRTPEGGDVLETLVGLSTCVVRGL